MLGDIASGWAIHVLGLRGMPPTPDSGFGIME
jgi:hypothetical protein